MAVLVHPQRFGAALLALALVAVVLAAAPGQPGELRKWGHLPRAYLPPPQFGGQRAAHRGNANSPAAQAELAALAARLLEDPPAPYPWQRSVRNVSDHGAVPDDGQLDDAALKRAIADACDASWRAHQDYLERVASAGTDLPRLPDGPDDFPVLVELRFEPGRYDLAGGLFKTDELVNCC